MKPLKKVLLLDDLKANNLILEELIRVIDSSVECISFTRAKDAINHLSSTDEFPELIITDLNMPEIDGFDFLEIYENLFFRENFNTKIFMVTASTSTKDRFRANRFKSLSAYESKLSINYELADLLVKHFPNIKRRMDPAQAN